MFNSKNNSKVLKDKTLGSKVASHNQKLRNR